MSNLGTSTGTCLVLVTYVVLVLHVPLTLTRFFTFTRTVFCRKVIWVATRQIFPFSTSGAHQLGSDPGGLEPGDKVLFPKDAGFDVRLGGTAVKAIRRGELIACVQD